MHGQGVEALRDWNLTNNSGRLPSFGTGAEEVVACSADPAVVVAIDGGQLVILLWPPFRFMTEALMAERGPELLGCLQVQRSIGADGHAIGCLRVLAGDRRREACVDVCGDQFRLSEKRVA